MAQPARSFGLLRTIVLIAAPPIVLAVLYLLSTGPAIVLLHAGYLDELTYSAVYDPLAWLCIRTDSDTLKTIWNEYNKIWLKCCGLPPVDMWYF